MFKCGMCELTITPKLGLQIPGYFEERIADGIIDDLYTKAVVFDDGKNCVAIAVLDMLRVNNEITSAVRSRVHKMTKIPEANVLVAATHCHTGGPVWYDEEFAVADDCELDYIISRTADAIYLAYQRRTEVKLGFGRGEEHETAFNRRYWMTDGKVHTWPGIGNKDNIKPAAPVDPEVDVIRIDTPDGKPIGVITNFANHLDVVGGTKYCADYPGELSRCVKKKLGKGVVSMFLNGCCGDITHIDYDGVHKIVKNHHIKIGRILAAKVLEVYSGVKTDDMNGTTVSSACKTIKIKRRQPTKQDYYDAINDVIKKTEKQDKNSKVKYHKPTTGNELKMAFSYLKETIDLYENPIVSENVELQAIRVGDICFSGLPGEMFAELGLDLKNRSPFDKNVVIELANSCYGYIATEKAFPEGGYEVSLCKYVNLVPKAGEMMNDAVLSLIDKIK